MTKRLKNAWLLFGIPAGLLGLHGLNNFYTFYKYMKVKDALVCDDIYQKVKWTPEDFMCFSPQTIQGTIWILAIVVLIFTLLIRFTRKAKR